MLIKEEVKTYLISLYCPHCNVELKISDTVLMVQPAKYQYKCPICDYSEQRRDVYPKIEYEKVLK